MDAEKLKLERKDSDVITALDLESEDAVDPALDKALRWKIDFRLIPLLCITYALQSIDKTTLSYAAVFGIRESLELVGTQFSWASSVFYLGYLVWEYPTNLLLQKLPVNTFLSVTVSSISSISFQTLTMAIGHPLGWYPHVSCRGTQLWRPYGSAHIPWGV